MLSFPLINVYKLRKEQCEGRRAIKMITGEVSPEGHIPLKNK
jgi:hypothetical protein